MSITQSQLYNQIVLAKRNRDIAVNFDVTPHNIHKLKKKMEEYGMLAKFGHRLLPTNDEDRLKFWLNRIEMWNLPEKVKDMYRTAAIDGKLDSGLM